MFQKRVFGSLESTERVTVRERGVIVGAWDISICHDYRGVADYQQFVPGRRRLAGHQQVSPVRR
jgi:hypothetical protein